MESLILINCINNLYGYWNYLDENRNEDGKRKMINYDRVFDGYRKILNLINNGYMEGGKEIVIVYWYKF